MKIPKTIKIGAHIVKVVLKPDLRDDGEDLSGLWKTETNTIYIESKQSKTQQEETLIHEILHVLNINIKELEIEFLAQGIYQVIKANPKVFQ